MIDQQTTDQNQQDLNTTHQTGGQYYLYATFWQRLGASVIDGLMIWLSFVIIMGSYVGIAFLALNQSTNPIAIGITIALGVLLYFALALVGPLFYYKYFYTKQGATIGKNVFNIKVIDKDTHQYLGWKGIFLRELFGKAASQAVYIVGGFTWIFSNKDRQAVHDHFANTIVVQTEGDKILTTNSPAEVSHTKTLIIPAILIALYFVVYMLVVIPAIIYDLQNNNSPFPNNDNTYGYDDYGTNLDYGKGNPFELNDVDTDQLNNIIDDLNETQDDTYLQNDNTSDLLIGN